MQHDTRLLLRVLLYTCPHTAIFFFLVEAENLFCRALCVRGRVGEGEDEGAWAVLCHFADEGLLKKPCTEV